MICWAASWEGKNIYKQTVWVGDHEPPHPEFFFAHIMCYVEATPFYSRIRNLNIFDLRGDDDPLCWMLESSWRELVAEPHNADLKLRILR